MTDLKVVDGGSASGKAEPTPRATRKKRRGRPPYRTPSMSDLEPHLRDAERLAAIISKLHISSLAGCEEIELPDDQYYVLIEVLLDRLRVETKKAREIFYLATAPS